MSILLWLLIIVIATFWHELGHYWVARAQGVGVKSFSIGMGPILARWRRGGTEWRLSALPIGGYVEIDGMAPTLGPDGRALPPRTGFARLPALGKIAVLLAGPVFNLILAIALLSANYTSQGVVTPLNDRARIAQVLPGSRAQQLGLRAGDVIVAIGGQDIPPSDTVDGKPRAGYFRLQDALAVSGPKVLRIERGGTASNKTVRDVRFDWQAGQNRKLGVSYGPDTRTERVNVGGALVAATRTTVGVVPQALTSFGSLFRNFFTLNVGGSSDVSGPIGTIGIIGQAAQGGIWSLVSVTALINLSLALFNLIPIPGLDGGRILLVIVQAALRRPLTFEQENFINFAGFAFVMLLIVFVVLGDVVRRL